jgi:S-(hydroxymethyl)glutathione dehydrogenase/alcohol dehydrogenase
VLQRRGKRLVLDVSGLSLRDTFCADTVQAFQLVTGRVWKGCAFGGIKGRSQLPDLVDDYMTGKLKVDEFITHRQPLDHINTAFQDMKAGDCIRCVVNMRNA